MGPGEPVLNPPRPGEVYWADLGEAGRRPVIVVSRLPLNRGRYVVVVPFTTADLERRRALPNCVFFARGIAGLPKDCVAQAEAVAQVSVDVLDGEAGPLGSVPSEKLHERVRALGWVIDAVCEPS